MHRALDEPEKFGANASLACLVNLWSKVHTLRAELRGEVGPATELLLEFQAEDDRASRDWDEREDR